jgi:CRISPR-associated exonuclease Cas4
MQLCAQALCLEEMLDVAVKRGAVYYGQPRRRSEVDLNSALREGVERLCSRARELYEAKRTPLPKPGKYCASCSIENICVPNLAAKDKSAKYIANLLEELAL